MSTFHVGDFSANSHTDDPEVPGAAVPNVGTPIRNVHPSCAACPKKGAHKGWISYDVQCPTFEKEQFLQACHDDMVEGLHVNQAINMLKHLHTFRVTKFSNEFKVSGPMSRETDPFELISCGSNSWTGKVIDQGEAGLGQWGVIELRNSKLQNHTGFLAMFRKITDDGSGNKTAHFYSFTPVGGLASARLNTSQPVSFVFRYYDPPPLFSELTKLDMMPCSWHTQDFALEDLSVGDNIVVDDGRRIAWDGRSVQRIESGAAEESNARLKNITVNGQNRVVLRVTSADIAPAAGFTAIRIGCWLEGNPVPAEETVTWERSTEGMTAQKYTVGSNKKWTGANPTFSMYAAGEWRDWWGSLENVYNPETGWYDVSWDLSNETFPLYWQPPTPEPTEENPNPDPLPPEPVESVKVTFQCWPNPGAEFHLLPSMCAANYPRYAQDLGLQDPTAGCSRYCLNWGDLSTQEKDAYTVHCCNEDCSMFAPGNGQRPTFDQTPVGGIVASLPFEAKYMAGIPTVQEFVRRGAPSLFSNVYEDIDAPGGPQHDKVENMHDCGGWGRRGTFMAEYQEEHEVWNEETQQNETVTETIQIPQVSLVGGMAAVRSKTPITSGEASLHRAEGEWRGHWLRKREHRAHVVVYPLIANTFDAQEYPDGTIERGFWTAAFEKQAEQDGSTAYFARAMIRQGIKPLKDTERRELAVVRTVRFATSNVSGKIPLRHASTSYSKPAGTGETEYPVTAKTGGTNVFNKDNPPTNYECPESLVGQGDDSRYIVKNMGLQIPKHPDIPEEYQGLVFKITDAHACDSELAHIDPDWAEESYKLENCYGLPDGFYDLYKFCDTIEVLDEQGMLSALSGSVDLTSMDLEIVESFWVDGEGQWAISSPTDDDATLGCTQLPASGLFYFTSDPVGKCVVGQVQQAAFDSLFSSSQDLQPITDTQARIDATSWQVSPAPGLNGDMRKWMLDMNFTEYDGGVHDYRNTIDRFEIIGPLNGAGQSGIMGVTDSSWHEDAPPAWYFEGHWYQPMIPVRSSLDHMWGDAGILLKAEANLAVWAQQSNILRTITRSGEGTVWEDTNEGPLNPPMSLVLYGLDYDANNAAIYSAIATAVDGLVSADGKSRIFNLTQFARTYMNNRTNFRAFAILPKFNTSLPTLPPGVAADKAFLTDMFNNGISRSLQRDSDGLVTGTIRLKSITWDIVTSLDGVMTLNNDGWELPNFARVPYYRPIPSNVKQ